MSSWGWRPERTQGIWRHGARWLRPLFAATPYLTLIFALLLVYWISGRMTIATGFMFDLPSNVGGEDVAAGDLVAIMVPNDRRTMVYFDDSRYTLEDTQSAYELERQMEERIAQAGGDMMLVLADRRIKMGELLQFTGMVKKIGIKKVLFAEKQEESTEQ